MMRKLMGIFLSFVMIFSLIGCSKTNDQTDEMETKKEVKETIKKNVEVSTISMTYFHPEEKISNFMGVIKEKVPNVNIEYQYIDMKQYNNVVNTQLAAGEGPDIFVSDKALIIAGYQEDISDQPYVKLYSDSGKPRFTHNGKIYGLPGTTWFEGIFYNKKIFKDNSIVLPKTFDEYLEIHRVLKENGVKPQTMGAKSWEPLNKSSVGFLLNEFYQSDEGKTFDGEFSQGTKQLQGTYDVYLAKWMELITEGYLDKTMLGLDYDQALEEFATEKAAMWESGPWSYETIKQKNPDLEFGMMPFYGTKEGTGWLVGGAAEGFAMNAQSSNKKIVNEIFKAMSTEEAQTALLKDRPGSSSYFVGVEANMPSEYDDCAEVFKLGNIATNWDRWPDIDISLIVEMGKQYQAVLAGQKDLNDAVKSMDKKADILRKK